MSGKVVKKGKMENCRGVDTAIKLFEDDCRQIPRAWRKGGEGGRESGREVRGRQLEGMCCARNEGVML